MKPLPMTLALAAVTALSAAACSSSSDYVYVAPATVSEAEAGLSHVDLTASAAERTGIEMTPVVTETIDGLEQLVIPYSAVMYHYDGTTWTYTSPNELSYLRAAIEIAYIEGDRAVLSAGPPEGTPIVSVGAAELYGAEFGVGK